MNKWEVLELLEWSFDENDLKKARKLLKIAIKHNPKVNTHWKRIKFYYGKYKNYEKTLESRYYHERLCNFIDLNL